MPTQINDKQDFTQGSIFSKLVNFMLPILLSLVLQSLYGAVDLLIVGHFGTETGISGVSVGGNIMNLFTMLVNSMTIGVTILIGQYIGAKKFDDVEKLIGNSVAFFLILSAVLTVLIVIFAEPLAVLMQTSVVRDLFSLRFIILSVRCLKESGIRKIRLSLLRLHVS